MPGQHDDNDDEEMRGEERAKRLQFIRTHAVRAAAKIFPYGVQVLASAAAYTLGLNATQVMGCCLRITCVTPVLGPALGMVGVGFASSLAGHAAAHARKLCDTGGNPLRPSWWQPVPADELVLDAVMGIFIFKFMGGRFSSLMPSDLRYPGARAFESIPAKGDEYARESVKRELARMFRRDGCHHCGSYKGPVIGDHMPPNKIVWGAAASRGKAAKPAGWLADNPMLMQIRQTLGASTKLPRQRFYPQCHKCSMRQAVALRTGKNFTVLHLHMPRNRPDQFTGIFVGLRHHLFSSPSSGPGAHGERVARWNSLGLTAALSSGRGLGFSAAADAAEQHEQHHGITLHDFSQPLVVPGGLAADMGPWAPDQDGTASSAVQASLGDWGVKEAGQPAPVATAPAWDTETDAWTSGAAKPAGEAKLQAQAAFQRHFRTGMNMG